MSLATGGVVGNANNLKDVHSSEKKEAKKN